MSPQELLEAEVSILLLRHGKKKLLQAIAHRMQLPEEVLISEISRLLRADFASAVKKKAQPAEFDIDGFLSKKSENSEILRKLFLQYENRTFLPELRDVKRFFDRHGMRKSLLKSRAAARSDLLEVLSKLNSSELRAMAENPSSEITSSSSLGLISDEILGRNRSENNLKNNR